jgi:hypothetical protein
MKRWLCTFVSVVLVLLAAACGGGGDDADDRTTTTEAPGGEAIGTNPEFCAAAAEVDKIFEEGDPNDFRQFVEEIRASEEAFVRYVATIPDDLTDEARIEVDALRALAAEIAPVADAPDAEARATAAFEKIATPEVEAASVAANEYAAEVCPGE